MARVIQFFVEEGDNDPIACEADVKITSLGSLPSYDHPGDPPEYEITALRIEKVEISRDHPDWEKLELLACKHMDEDFDWAEHVAGLEFDYDESRYER